MVSKEKVIEKKLDDVRSFVNALKIVLITQTPFKLRDKLFEEWSRDPVMDLGEKYVIYYSIGTIIAIIILTLVKLGII